VIENSKKHDAMPELLGYKIRNCVGEILMTHGGQSLQEWMKKLDKKSHRKSFMIEMLKQIMPALAKLHSLGYSHGDLKPDNICARPS
jgi:serine/threonine protein kinase